MNRIRILVAGAAVFAVAASFCHAQKTGYVDSKKIFENYKGAGDIKQQVNRALDAWNREIEAKRAEIDSLQRDLEAQNLVISSERRRLKQEEIKARSKEVETLIHQVYDPAGKLDARNKELSKPMVEKIGGIIKKVALDNNILLVLDSSSGMVVYADKDLDLTDQVLEELARMEGTVVQSQASLVLFPVWDADPEAVRKKLGKLAFGYLYSSLGRSQAFKPLAQKLVKDLVKDKGLEEKQVSDARGMELAKILTAQYSVSGDINYNPASGQITIKLRLFNVDTGMMLAEESEAAASQNELSGACENLVARLAQKAGGK